MGENQATELGKQAKTPGDLLNTYILAGIGFSCLIGWELSAVFSPSLSLLSFTDIQTAVGLRIVSALTLAATFIFFFQKEDWLFEHRNTVFTIGSLFALIPVINTMANTWIEGIPFAFSVAAWALFGFAQASLMMYWCIFFSLIPTRWTAVTIALGSCGGTLLFFFTNSSESNWLNLIEISFLIVGSIGIAAFLSLRIPAERILPVQDYNRSAVLTMPAALSVLCHGAVYGFISLMVCIMGSVPAIIMGVSGIVGSIVALIWGYLGPKVDIDTGVVQRISLPLLVGGLLLFPYFEGPGRIVCGCIVNAALAHSQIIAWYSTSIDNAEFRLHPVDRFAMRQTPNWIGFFCGAVVAYLISFVFHLSDQQFMFAMVVFVLIVIVGFSIYGGDESKTKRRLNELLTTSSDESDEDADSEEKTAPAYFRQRCDNVVEHYELTAREAEVFFHLAKGRNAEYISRKLFISSATVKSHIYHIYQKLGINSQQRLMTIVDETDAEGES